MGNKTYYFGIVFADCSIVYLIGEIGFRHISSEYPRIFACRIYICGFDRHYRMITIPKPLSIVVEWINCISIFMFTNKVVFTHLDYLEVFTPRVPAPD